jgi:signal recognition particle receptor subunit beta
MAHINFARREVTCKIVYYGPGMSGKTTNLEMVHEKAPPTAKGELTAIKTEGDRTLFFDFLPLDLGEVAGMRTKFQLYTVPGQVYYDSTRKLVLQGSDGIGFVADSQRDKMDENKESLENLYKNLRENGIDPDSIPIVLQWNKRDMDNIFTVEEMEKELNPDGKYTTFEAVAFKGDGVMATLKGLSKLVLEKLNDEYGSKRGGGGAAPAAKSAAAPPAAADAPAPAAAAPAPATPPPAAAPPPVSAPEKPAAPPAAPSTPPPAAPPAAPATPPPAAPPAAPAAPPKQEAPPEPKPEPKKPAEKKVDFRPQEAPKKKGCAGVLLAIAAGLGALGAVLLRVV